MAPPRTSGTVSEGHGGTVEGRICHTAGLGEALDWSISRDEFATASKRFNFRDGKEWRAAVQGVLEALRAAEESEARQSEWEAGVAARNRDLLSRGLPPDKRGEAGIPLPKAPTPPRVCMASPLAS